MNLSKNFTLEEATFSNTARQQKLANTPTPTNIANMTIAAEQLQLLRDHLNVPISINSWFRNPQVNRAVGGESASDHLTGLAIDCTAHGFGSVQQLCLKASTFFKNFDQIIYEQGNLSEWMHISFSPKNRKQLLSWKSGKGYVNGIKKL